MAVSNPIVLANRITDGGATPPGGLTSTEFNQFIQALIDQTLGIQTQEVDLQAGNTYKIGGTQIGSDDSLNNSGVTGATVSDALDTLDTAISPEFLDNVFRVNDNGDPTRQLALQLTNLTTATTRTLTVQDSDGTIALTSDIPTLPDDWHTITVDNGTAVPSTPASALSILGGDGIDVDTLSNVITVKQAPLTTKGDIFIMQDGGTPEATRLAAGTNGQVLSSNSIMITGLEWITAAGTGDVVGPASATDNAVVRYDLTTGKLIQNSSVLIDDSDNVTGVVDLTMSGQLAINNVSPDGVYDFTPGSVGVASYGYGVRATTAEIALMTSMTTGAEVYDITLNKPFFYNGTAWIEVGDVAGPSSATDNAIVRYDLTTGRLIQDSSVIIDDSDNITGVVDLTITGNASIGGQSFSPTQTLSDGVNISWNLDSGNNAKVTLAGNRTLDNPTNMQDGGTYSLISTQDVTGSRTLAYGSAYKFPGGTAFVLSTAGNAVDILTFISDGTNMYMVGQKAFA